MTGVSSGSVEVQDGTLAYEATGEGPPVVLIHPGLWDMRTWDDQFEEFGSSYRVIRYDVRGYGRSSRLTGGPYSHVRDLLTVFDALEIDNAIVVGCSMGGTIAIEFTLEHPDRVTALVAVAAGVDGFDVLPEEDEWWMERWAPVREALDAGELERARDLQLEIWAPLGTEDPAGRRIREIAFDNIHELTMDESGAEELDPPPARRLSEIDVPTLVLIAESDPPDMRRIGELIAGEISGAREVIVVGADHVVNMRRPEEFSRLLWGFLGELD